MSGSRRPLPRLLVSVRSVEEAADAIAGGCDLLDLKEPHRGSLGRLDVQTIEDVCSFLARVEQSPPVSVALGELNEWADVHSDLRLPGTVSYVKLGLASAPGTWRSDWRKVRETVSASTAAHINWISVHYCDPVSGSPPFNEVLAEAIAAGCRGLLIDTYSKQRGRLLDFVSPGQLAEIHKQTASAGLIFAVAGSLRTADLPQLVDVSPEIIAVRGAVCRSSDRTATISQGAVREFRQEIACVFSSEAEVSAAEAATTPIVAI